MRVKVLLTTSLICACWTLTYATVLIADHSMSKMIELTTKTPFCIFHTDRGKIRTMLLNSDPRRMRQMSDDAINQLEYVCNEGLVTSSYQGGFIYPGTKWCGPGTVAKEYDELGIHNQEDKCCREHDHCANALAPGECRQGICNKSPFTRSHCDCDAEFRRCLQNVNTETANTIGAIFFNIVQVICFKERRPCSQWQSLHENDCKFGFARTARFIPSRYPVTPRGQFDLNGYAKDESDKLCAEWKYRPSEKYVPLMPHPTH